MAANPNTEAKVPPAVNSMNDDIVTSQPAVNTQQPLYEKPNEMHPVAHAGTQEWLTGKWDCFEGEDNLCIKTCCCPCFVHGKTATRIRDPSMATYERFNKDCLIWAGAQYFGCGWVLTFLARGGIRKMYDLRGEDINDCAFSYCCACCAIMQQEKEIISRQAMGPTNVGYVAPAGMNAHVQ